jgi:hypothetical protein
MLQHRWLFPLLSAIPSRQESACWAAPQAALPAQRPQLKWGLTLKRRGLSAILAGSPEVASAVRLRNRRRSEGSSQEPRKHCQPLFSEERSRRQLRTVCGIRLLRHMRMPLRLR